MKRVVVLVGPKGSGKSTIGALLETRLAIRFLRVEPLFLAVRTALGQDHPEFERRGFEAVLAKVGDELACHDTVCLETTGASSELPWFLGELRRTATLSIVQVRADPKQCVERVRRRDTSIHIPVSDAMVDRINALAFQVELPFDGRVDNRGSLDPDMIVEMFKSILDRHQSEPASGENTP